MSKEEELNVIFLDFDGVINIKTDNFTTVQSEEAIKYLNKLCLETGFKIVVCSSWRDHMHYKKFLYDSGLDKRIEILGKTDYYGGGRIFEIQTYIEENNINKYLIIDDAFFGERYVANHVQTAPSLGFTKNKYEEALEKISKMSDRDPLAKFFKDVK